MTAQAATVAHFTASGIQDMGGSSSFGSSDITTKSTAMEVVFDFTTTFDALTSPVVLWEAGGSGTGSALIIEGDQVFFYAGNGSDDVISGNHGITSPTTGVQIVTVFEIGAGTGTDELLSIYVNGSLVAQGDANTSNDWAGGENPGSGLGSVYGTIRSNGTSQGSPVDYPETNIDFAIYQLASDGGPADNTVANIVIPEPTAALLSAFGSLFLLRRRRR